MKRIRWGREIKGSEKILKEMHRCLEKEIRIIRFYEENLHVFNNAKDRKKIKQLVLASLKHAGLFIGEIHRLQGKVKGKKISGRERLKSMRNVAEGGIREEYGAMHIYITLAKMVKDKKASETLMKIASEEENHHDIVKRMQMEINRKLSRK